MLSGVATSQSEAAAQSKDPYKLIRRLASEYSSGEKKPNNPYSFQTARVLRLAGSAASGRSNSLRMTTVGDFGMTANYFDTAANNGECSNPWNCLSSALKCI
jgi:hypothetical protein